MKHTDQLSLVTKRVVIGHVAVFQGCCCGNTANGRPPVAVDWLKKELRAEVVLLRAASEVLQIVGWERHAHGVQHRE